MTAQSTTVATLTVSRRRAGVFLGFGTVLGKEITEWFKGPKALIVAVVSIASAVLTTLIPLIVEATESASAAGPLTKDPTTNVLLGWTGQTIPLIAVVATMAMISVERDRGTLAWSLTNPVSPTSIIAAKFVAAMLVFSATAFLLPLVVSIGVATVAYGGMPDLSIVGTFALLFLTLPAFYVALTVGLGTFIKSTGGVAGTAFVVMFVPLVVGGIVPVFNELAPTSIGTWAMAAATGQPASMLTLAGWLVSMVVIAFGSKIAFDRQEL
jgi:ABC-type transport system involved in multi-copper enzyme maturation permease subunit